MADLSKLSDAELIALYKQKQATPEQIPGVAQLVGGQIADTLGAVGAFGRGGARGLPGIGKGMDEAYAFINTLGPAGNYDRELERQRQVDVNLEQAYPGTSAAGELTGGILGAILALKAGGKALPKTFGPKALEKFATQPRMVRAGKLTAGGAAVGGMEGLISGFGEGEEGLANRLASAGEEGLEGTGWGAMGGPLGMVMAKALPPVTKGAKWVAEKVGAIDTPKFDTILDALGLSKKQFPAYVKAAEADDALRPGGAGRIALKQAGPGAIVGEAGPATQEMMDTIRLAGGKGAALIDETAARRVSETGQGVREGMTESFGEPVGMAIRQKAKRALERPKLYEKYKTAYSRLITPDKEFKDLVGRVDKGTHNRALSMMKKEHGKVPKEPSKSTLYLDYVTRALQDLPENEKGVLGGLTDIGRINVKLAQDIRGKLKSLNKDYGKALESGQEAIEQGKALDFGYDLLDPRVPMDKATLDWQDLYADKGDTVRQGIRDYLETKMASVTKSLSGKGGDVAEIRKELSILSSDAARSKLALVLSPEQMDKFYAKLGMAESAITLKAGLKQGSQTAQRITAKEQQERILEDPSKVLSKTLGTGGLQSTAIKALEIPISRGKAAQQAAEEKYFESGAKFLTQQKPAKVMHEVRKAQRLEDVMRRGAQRTKAKTGMATAIATPAFVNPDYRRNRGQQ